MNFTLADQQGIDDQERPMVLIRALQERYYRERESPRIG